MDEKVNDNKSKILIILVIILFVLLTGMIIFKYKNSEDNINKKENIINRDEVNQLENKKLNRNSSISDVKIDSNKINVYFFWGDGCPHCAQEFEFLEKHYNEYKKYCNIYAFEVWNNEENAELMNKCGEILNEEIGGVPLTIIGKEKLIGYSETTGDKIDNLIKEEYEKEGHYDIYNEIKEENNEE